MKRYNIVAKPWDSYSADWDSVESPTGEWVRYEDLVAAQAAAKASHAELEELRARVTRAVTVLATPGTWSEFAAKALKELRGG